MDFTYGRHHEARYEQPGAQSHQGNRAYKLWAGPPARLIRGPSLFLAKIIRRHHLLSP